MNNKRIFSVIVCVTLGFLAPAVAQKVVRHLSLNQVIDLARGQSLEACVARNRYLGSFWEYRTFRADYLPKVSLSAILPDLNRSISRITRPDGKDQFVRQKMISNYGGVTISQNVGITGGTLSVISELEQVEWLDSDNKVNSYRAVPLSLNYTQPLFSFNAYKWDKKIEPLKYKKAQRNYVVALEELAQKSVDLYFDQLLAQLNLGMAQSNLANSDTIFKIAQGRYNIGTIAQNELLQTELSFLNAGSELNEARLEMEMTTSRLRSFLGFDENVELELEFIADVPYFMVDAHKARELALERNPQMTDLTLQEMQARREVSRTKAENRFRADLNASFGLSQSASELKDAYKNPQDQERVRLGINVPILDWGKGKGRVRMAQSNQEVAHASVKKATLDFLQEVYLQVMRFNMQDEQLKLAQKSELIARNRYNVTKSRYFIGKVNVLDLNVAQSEKDRARRAYVEALRRYWRYLYAIRKLTLYDFQNNMPLDKNLEGIN